MKYLLLLLFAILVHNHPINSQILLTETIQKNYIDTKIYKLLNTEISKNENKIVKTFKFNVLKSGRYYIYAWIFGNERTNNLDVSLNKTKSNDFAFINDKSNWHLTKISNIKEAIDFFYFEKGENSISFTTNIPEIPQVEFIVLSENILGHMSTYDQYLDSIKTPSILELKESTINITSADDPPYGSNPVYDYDYKMNITYSYSYWTTFYFYAGTQVEFETKKLNPYGSDPVMYLSYGTYPINGSWANDNGGSGFQSKISATIPKNGVYYLILRSKSPNAGQTSDLWFNGSLYALNVPINGYYTSSVHNTIEELNYFTSYNFTGDPRLWVECYNSSHNRLLWWNDNFEGGGDYDWLSNARVKKAFDSNNYPTGVLVTSSSYYPTGTCDLYIGCKNGIYSSSSFPNLNSVDAINSHSSINSERYNCYSWAGGITSEDLQPHQSGDGGPYWDPDQLTSFKNFFGNKDLHGNPLPRYNGAINYTTTGATTTNAVIDLWGVEDVLGEIQYTHASVRKPGNNHIHGYDWESKNGKDPRFFHPRFGIQGGKMGFVKNHFISDGTYSFVTKEGAVISVEGVGLTMEESIRNGLTELDVAKFNASEQLFLDSLIQNISPKILGDYIYFENEYLKIMVPNYLRVSKEHNKYRNFLEFCEDNITESLPLMMKRYDEGRNDLIIVLNDLLFPAYENIRKEVFKATSGIRLTKDGKYIAPSPKAFNMRLFKEILKDKNYRNQLIARKIEKQPINNDSNENSKGMIELANYPNPYNNSTIISFSLPSSMILSLNIYNILGEVVATIINNELKDAGVYKLSWDGVDNQNRQLSSGTYIYILRTGNRLFSQKMLLVK